MLWYITNDIKYFTNKKEQIFNNKEVLILPKNDDEVIEKIKSLTDKNWKDFIVLDVVYPTERLKSLFVIKEISNQGNFLTTQEVEHKVSLEEVLQTKLGLIIRRPKTTYNDMKGFEEVVEILDGLDEKVNNDKNFSLKPLFFLGMAGTGKSRIAEAYAGQHNIPLIDLNISAIAEDKKPLKKLNEVFGILSSFNEKLCLRLDEFEQMSKNEDLLGEMLTILNDLNKGGYNFKGMMFLTSNNISELIKKIPQFFRHGRFSEKLFISFPKKENAIKVMGYFNKVFDLNYSESELEQIYLYVETTYKDDNFTWQENRSPYVPAEFEALFGVLKDKSFGEFDKKIVSNSVKEVKPLLVTGKEGVQRMYQKAKEQEFKEI